MGRREEGQGRKTQGRKGEGRTRGEGERKKKE